MNQHFPKAILFIGLSLGPAPAQITPASERNALLAKAYHKQGDAWLRVGEYAKAVQAYQQAVERNPQDVEAYRGMAAAYGKLGQSREMDAALKKAASLQQGSPAAAPLNAAPAPGATADPKLRTPTLAPGSKPLSGLYLQVATQFGNFTTNRSVYNYYYFWPDGRLCEKLPTGGADPVDFERERQKWPKLCGRYVFTGKQMTIDVPDGPQPYVYPVLDFDGTNFRMNVSGTSPGTMPYPMVKVKSFPNNHRLDGTFKGTILGDHYRVLVLTFRQDGTYSLEDKPLTSSDGPPKHAAGQYTLSGNTLTLKAPGNFRRYTVFPLVVDGKTLLQIEGDEFRPK